MKGGKKFMDILKTFAANLKKYRLSHRLSQEKLAELCDLHRTYISDVERLKRSISLKNIQGIADALSIKTYMLFLEEEGVNMIMTYEHFIDTLNKRVKTDEQFYYELLTTVVKNPKRFTGIFRLSNAKTKLIQNVTQSREIKFGDFMEEIITEYISLMGYENMDKSIGNDPQGNALSADQVFKKDNCIYLIEQKIRDDHDSTKKRGQYDNFRKKYTLLKQKYPNYKINASMWFIDDSLVKNKKYYFSEAISEKTVNEDIKINIFYGGDMFSQLFNRYDVWNEICTYLLKNKQERNNDVLEIPDFDTSQEMLNALKRLKTYESGLFKKLISDKPEYVQLRKELFPTETNLNFL